MRRRFGLVPEQSPRNRVIILIIDGRVLGLIVDSVTEVVRIPRSAIRPAPGILGAQRAPYFMGICHYKERFLILLNVRNIVESDEPIEPPTGLGFMGDGA